MSNFHTFRDDDPGVHSNALLFRQVHDLFDKYKKTHSCGVIMRDLWENKELWYLLVTKPNIEICLHGLDHIDYGVASYEKIVEDIKESLEYWRVRVGRGYGADKIKPIKKFYPPWHSTSTILEKACKDCGLELDARREPDGVFCFHYWEAIDPQRLINLEKIISEKA
jgi:hypothetical protein